MRVGQRERGANVGRRVLQAMRALLRCGVRIAAHDPLPAIAAVTVMATLLSLFGRYSWLLDLLTFGRQHLAATSVLLLLAALCARRRRLALIAIACVVVNGTPLLPSPNASVGHARRRCPRCRCASCR